MNQATRTPSDPKVPALAAHALQKRFGDVHAVAGIDLCVEPGECVGLLGPNGAGKTTAIEMLVGLKAPDSGTIELFGEDFGPAEGRGVSASQRRARARMRERIGVQLQETQLADKLTVLEVTRLFRSFYTRGRAALDVLAAVGLVEKRDARVHQLSGGQRQRLAVATALVGGPDLLFLDEPTTGLDPQARRALWDVVESYRADGGAILLTTHYMDEAAQLCDSISIMDRGKIIARGSPEELIAGLGAGQVLEIELAGDTDAVDFTELAAVRDVARREGAFVLRTDDVGRTLPAVVALLEARGLGIETLSTHQATLEDVFLDLTGRALRDG